MAGESETVQQSVRAKVGHHNGRPTIFVDGKPRSLAMYSPMAGTPRWAAKWRPALDRFLAQPMDVYMVRVPQIRPSQKIGDVELASGFWQGDTITSRLLEGATTEDMDAGAEYVLARDPKAYLMIRFTPCVPTSWAELHPDEMMVNEAGERLATASLASSLYAEGQAAFCRSVIEYCESRPWSARVLGYVNIHLAEGTHRPMINHWLCDQSPVMTRRWREYLKGKYGSSEALREAYGDPSLELDSIDVPRDRLRGALPEVAESLHWQAGRDNAPLRDYLLLLRDLYHHQLRLTARASREAAGADKLLLHDIAKLEMQGWSNMGFFDIHRSWPMVYSEYLAGSGNMALSSLLEMDEIDGLYTPYDYLVRGAGGIFEPEGMVDSALLRGKVFITEHDLRTYRQESGKFPVGYARQFGITRDLDEFKAVTWRDLAAALTRGYLNCYVDHTDDYFSDPPMHDVIRRQIEVIRESAEWTYDTQPGIAVIVDDKASLQTNGSGHVMHETVMWEIRNGLSRCGAAWRVYTFEDLELDDFPDHRVFYFPNLYHVDEARLAVLKNRVLRDGKVVVWGPGSGISDGTSIGRASAEALTGFTFAIERVNYQRRVQVTNFDHPITQDLSPDTIFGSSVAYGPVLYPTDGEKLGLAYAKRGGDRVGLAVKSFGGGVRREGNDAAALGEGDYAAVFTTASPLPASLWRGVAQYAGAHLFIETNDVVMASRDLVAVHTLKSGERTICFPRRGRVVDLITGETVAASADRITATFQSPATHFYRLV